MLNKQQNFLEPAIIEKFMAWLAGFAQISLMEMDYNVFGNQVYVNMAQGAGMSMKIDILAFLFSEKLIEHPI